ncbi:bifunctional helix-turn-helix transcriptional regulator/GNAT family N-acetyltransferase [Orrella sp. JC864]|uniref:helix-turn-helix domain-containing GNAT family N-acetyltransferase n=1 Tax=Orrella sp. JC864 TaxID=3120298 RepID=UPI00300A199E
MPSPGLALVDEIRAASRQMVRELGFMQATLAATGYPPSAVHAILEIGAQGRMTAAQLGELLRLEKSSVSRMLRKLVQAGELKESASRADGRVKWLALTAKGRRTHAAIQAYGRRQVSTALAGLAPPQQHEVAAGLAAYARALTARREGGRPAPPPPLRIEPGHRPGALGRIVQMHACFYTRHAGFGLDFESQVARDLAEFAPRLRHPCNGLWLALDGERVVGSVAIDGQDLGPDRAHLRWFIMDEGLRGAGAGRRLLRQALDFCDARRVAAIELWTFQGLDAARRLYESAGFALAEAAPGRRWGREVLEQRFVRSRPPA